MDFLPPSVDDALLAIDEEHLSSGPVRELRRFPDSPSSPPVSPTKAKGQLSYILDG